MKHGEKTALWLVPRLYKLLMTMIMGTCRVRFIGRDAVGRLEEQGRTWIFTAWHENTAVSVFTERRKGLAMMASDSRDGEFIARGIEVVGNIAVRGSSSRGGAKAVKSMVRWLKSGHSAAVTPDGPRGPRHQLQPGIFWISVMSGAPLVPYHVVASRQWVFRRTWDQHRIPKPFSRVFVAVGEPYFVDRERLRSDEAGILAEFAQRMAENVSRAEAALLDG
ncbi:MAG: lysophospholipid acyltransferase family protein [Pseudomonadota bacterium]